MKLNVLSLSALITSLLMSYAHVHAATVLFEIEGIKSDSGKLYVSLFKGQENYKAKKPEKSLAIDALAGNKEAIFENITTGEYVIQYFHDENNNKKLETNLFGMPTEGFGFSNDAKPNYGPAKYEDMKFVVSGESETVTNNSTVIY